MSGYINDLSPTQKEKLGKFRESVKDILLPFHDDEILLRFLRARRWDLKKSEKMIRNDRKWRDENKVWDILDWFKVPEVLQKYWVGGLCGLDKRGNGVFISPVGAFDPKGLLYSAKNSDILKNHVHFLESLIKTHSDLVEKQGVKKGEGSFVVIDLEDLGVHHLWKPGIDLFNKTNVISEQHYPELLYKVFVVRTPKFFPVAYSLVKPFLREDTRKKIHIFRTGSNWKEEILKYVDADQLPVYWGGTKKDPDGNEKCPSLIGLGGKIPKDYYLKDRATEHELTTHHVSRGGVIEFKYETKKPHCVFRYEFKTDSSDIRFGFDRVEGKKKIAILKLEKYNSHMVPENGEISISDPGTYVARFDNSHGWKGRHLSYWLELLEPADEEPEFKEMVDGDKLD